MIYGGKSLQSSQTHKINHKQNDSTHYYRGLYDHYLGESDACDPGHEVLPVGHTQMNYLLLVLGQRTSRLR